MKRVCVVCGRQIINGQTKCDEFTTHGPCKAGFRLEEPFCFYCGMDLDENGAFPEEAKEPMGSNFTDPEHTAGLVDAWLAGKEVGHGR